MTTEKTPKKRRVLMIAGPLVLAVVAGGWWLMGGRYQTTENAYLHEARISIAASVGGRVQQVMITDNQVVKANDPLFSVDNEPYRLALAQSDLSINAARIGIEQLKQAYLTAKAQLRISEDEAKFQTSERIRQEGLAAKGAATGTNLDAAVHSEQRAFDQRDLSKQSVATALAALGGVADAAAEDHPIVQAAMVARDQAAYNLANATVKAPADGVIYQAASFKAGQMVAAGQSLFSLVETGDVWVDANFKETQLDGIVAGRPATITFDVNAGRSYDAVVEAVGAGTGSEFSLLPAQNATGNWVKVTQRVPVRLRLLNPANAAGLASGISAKVSVDTGHKRSLTELFGQ